MSDDGIKTRLKIRIKANWHGRIYEYLMLSRKEIEKLNDSYELSYDSMNIFQRIIIVFVFWNLKFKVLIYFVLLLDISD